jgi:hypothetical protein
MRALARPLVFAAVLLGMSLASSPALASCLQATVAQQAALADVVVYGTVTETRQTFAPASGVIRFRADRFLKGSLPGEVEVYLGPTRGGAITSVDYSAVIRGEGHTLYLKAAGNGAWQTDACSGSHVGAPTAEERRSSAPARPRRRRRQRTTRHSLSAHSSLRRSRSQGLYSRATRARPR